jgi:hypothetical protein
MSDSGRRSWGSQQTGKWLRVGKRDKPTRSLPRGLVPPPTHGGAAVITNGQPTLPLRVKIVTWGRAASVEGLRRAGGHVVRRFPKK